MNLLQITSKVLSIIQNIKVTIYSFPKTEARGTRKFEGNSRIHYSDFHWKIVEIFLFVNYGIMQIF
jgi:hypothetical protein